MDNDLYKNIPKILKDLNIWLCYDDRDKENPKAPRDTEGKIHSINGRLYTFNQCINSIKRGKNSGLGIVCKNNGVVCIDYDNCIKDYEYNSKYGITRAVFKDKDTEDRILRDLKLIDSYTEISPSGKGLHIYLIANADITINTNKNDIEIYTNHFIRVSGNLYNEVLYNDVSDDKTAELLELINLYDLNTSDNIINNGVINKKLRTIYTEILLKKFKYTNSYTNKEILNSMFNSKEGKFLKDLYNNTLLDADYKQYKVDKLEILLKKGKITRERYKELYNKIDTSNSGKSYTLIMNLLHFSYGDLKRVKELFIKSALCKDDYLDKRYLDKNNKYKLDKIDSQFIPRAIINYINYSE